MALCQGSNIVVFFFFFYRVELGILRFVFVFFTFYFIDLKKKLLQWISVLFLVLKYIIVAK